MASLLKKTDKDGSEKVLTTDQEQVVEKKKDAAKKLVPKTDSKKAVPVKKERSNSLERARSYLRGVYGELRKVHWPTRREVLIYTVVVVVAVLIVGVLIWVFDSVMSRLLQLIIR